MSQGGIIGLGQQSRTMTGATENAAGAAGLVPVPSAGDQGKFLRGDATWVDLQTQINGKIPSSEKGAANGVATLDGSGKVPSSQLPSYVDDVLEYNSVSDFPVSGETGKIYVARDTGDSYRWTGSAYLRISQHHLPFSVVNGKVCITYKREVTE